MKVCRMVDCFGDIFSLCNIFVTLNICKIQLFIKYRRRVVGYRPNNIIASTDPISIKNNRTATLLF